MAMKKGISPLIAAVLLVAFTMSIAGLMAAWATSFTQERLGALECGTAIDISELTFFNENVSIRIRNDDASFSLNNLTMAIVYDDVSLNRENVPIANTGYEITTGNRVKVEVAAKSPLNAGESTSAKVNTFLNIKPKKAEVNSINCKQPMSRNF